MFQDEGCPSICSEFFEDQEHTIAEIHHEERLVAIQGCFLIPPNQQEPIFHYFQDPVENSLQPVVKVNVAAFIDEGDQFQHIGKSTVWNEVCFPILNHPEKHMFHAFHDPLLSLLQSSVEEEFFKFFNTGVESIWNIELPIFFFSCLLKESVSMIQVSSH